MLRKFVHGAIVLSVTALFIGTYFEKVRIYANPIEVKQLLTLMDPDIREIDRPTDQQLKSLIQKGNSITIPASETVLLKLPAEGQVRIFAGGSWLTGKTFEVFGNWYMEWIIHPGTPCDITNPAALVFEYSEITRREPLKNGVTYAAIIDLPQWLAVLPVYSENSCDIEV